MQSFKKQYTHFLSLPFLREEYRYKLKHLQSKIHSAFCKKYEKKQILESRSTLAHVSLCMLTLQNHKMQRRAQDMLSSLKQDIQTLLDNTALTFSRLKYFTRYNHESKKQEVSVIYLTIQEDESFNRVLKVTDKLIRALLKEKIITQDQMRRLRLRYSSRDQLYKCQNYHLTLFRMKDVQENQEFKKNFQQICSLNRPLKFGLDAVDISTRFSYDSSDFYRPLKRIILQSKQ